MTLKSKKIVHITGNFNNNNNFQFSSNISLNFVPNHMTLLNYHWYEGSGQNPLLLSPVSFIDCDLCGHICMLSSTQNGDHTCALKYPISGSNNSSITFRLINLDGTLPNAAVILNIGLSFEFSMD